MLGGIVAAVILAIGVNGEIRDNDDLAARIVKQEAKIQELKNTEIKSGHGGWFWHMGDQKKDRRMAKKEARMAKKIAKKEAKLQAKKNKMNK